MAVGRLTPSAKCLWVESPELTKADSEDEEPVGQTSVQLLLTEITMAWHCTKLILDTELIKF